LKALEADATHFADLGRTPVHADTQAATWEGIGAAGPLESTRPLSHTITDYWFTNAIARASQTMAQCSREFGAANQMAAE